MPNTRQFNINNLANNKKKIHVKLSDYSAIFTLTAKAYDDTVTSTKVTCSPRGHATTPFLEASHAAM